MVNCKQLVLSAVCLLFAAATIGGCGNAGSGDDKYAEFLKLASQGKYSEINSLCDEKLKSSPEDAEILAYRGLAETCDGKAEEGKASLLRAISLNPKRAWYHVELSRAYLSLGWNREALQSCAEAKNLTGDKKLLASMHSGMAIAYQNLNEIEKSIYEADQALKLEPDQKGTYRTRALDYIDLYEYQKAIADANKSIELDDKDPLAYTTRATIYLVTGDLAKATADTQKALNLKKDMWQAIELQSAIALIEGRPEEASKLADQLIETKPKLLAGYCAKAIACLALNDIVLARKMADKASEIDNGSHGTIETCLYVAARSGNKVRVDEQVARLQKVLDGGRRLARVHAVALFLLSQYKETVAFCTAAISPDEKAPALYRIRAQAYRKLHMDDLADVDMKRALAQGYAKKSILEQYLNFGSQAASF